MAETPWKPEITHDLLADMSRLRKDMHTAFAEVEAAMTALLDETETLYLRMLNAGIERAARSGGRWP
jgi:hypothetical protein